MIAAQFNSNSYICTYDVFQIDNVQYIELLKNIKWSLFVSWQLKYLIKTERLTGQTSLWIIKWNVHRYMNVKVFVCFKHQIFLNIYLGCSFESKCLKTSDNIEVVWWNAYCFACFFFKVDLNSKLFFMQFSRIILSLVPFNELC